MYTCVYAKQPVKFLCKLYKCRDNYTDNEKAILIINASINFSTASNY